MSVLSRKPHQITRNEVISSICNELGLSNYSELNRSQKQYVDYFYGIKMQIAILEILYNDILAHMDTYKDGTVAISKEEYAYLELMDQKLQEQKAVMNALFTPFAPYSSKDFILSSLEYADSGICEIIKGIDSSNSTKVKMGRIKVVEGSRIIFNDGKGRVNIQYKYSSEMDYAKKYHCP